MDHSQTPEADGFSPVARALLTQRGLGELTEKLGIRLLALSADHAVATMPVGGNRQPWGVLHGGAHLVLAETLGSLAANVWAAPDRIAVGIEIGASHVGSVRAGLVTGTCTAVHLGRSLTTHEIVVTDESGRTLSTARITNYLRRPDTDAAPRA